eukprot:349672_1
MMNDNEEYEIKEMQNKIQKLIGFSSDVNKLLNAVNLFDERIMFAALGEYLNEAFDVSVNKVIDVLQNNVFQSLEEECVKNNEQCILSQHQNHVIDYFKQQNITGNKLKSIGEKQFTISLSQFIDQNKEQLIILQLNRLYNILLRRLQFIPTISVNNIDDTARICLFYVDCSDLVLNTLIKLFLSKQQVLNANQILLCTENTTFEEINCLLYRFHNDKEGLLYCLVQPENLTNNTTQQVLKILNKQTNHSSAMLAVITSDTKSKWYSILNRFKQNMDYWTESEKEKFYNQYICTDLKQFMSEKISNNNPLCIVFSSDEPCVGKTYQINKICNENDLPV